MSLKFLILVVCMSSFAVATDFQVVGVKDAAAAAHENPARVAGADETTVPVKKFVPPAPPAPVDPVGIAHHEDKGKSLKPASKPDEPITLYRHDREAGIYRTESGDLVKMYRLEKTAGKPSRRALPMRRNAPTEAAMAEKQRMFSDWFSNSYGYDPYGTSSYAYNYNYGTGMYPYSSYGNYYSPYMGGYLGGGYPYSGLGMLGYGGYGY